MSSKNPDQEYEHETLKIKNTQILNKYKKKHSISLLIKKLDNINHY